MRERERKIRRVEDWLIYSDVACQHMRLSLLNVVSCHE